MEKRLCNMRDLAIFIAPTLASFLINVFEVRAVFQPDLHLVRRANRHQKIALELRV